MAIIYKSVSLLSDPSKIFEAEINFRLVHDVLEANKLITDKQWAYRRGYSPELLEKRRKRKAAFWWRLFWTFRNPLTVCHIKRILSWSHEILLQKLESNFRIRKDLLEWIKSHLGGRMQLCYFSDSTGLV